jgi:hypothetical protein
MAKSLSQIMKRSGDFTKFSNQILYNRFVLYFIFILAVGNLFHFVFSKDMMSVGAFIAAGLLTSFFSKNMVVIMVIAMVVSNVIRLSNGRDGFTGKKAKWQEAMDEMFENAMNEAFEDEDEDEDDYEDDYEDEEMEEDEEEEGFSGRREGFNAMKKAIKKMKTGDHKHDASSDGHTKEKNHKVSKHPH